jgi:hypothetical protein
LNPLHHLKQKRSAENLPRFSSRTLYQHGKETEIFVMAVGKKLGLSPERIEPWTNREETEFFGHGSGKTRSLEFDLSF